MIIKLYVASTRDYRTYLPIKALIPMNPLKLL